MSAQLTLRVSPPDGGEPVAVTVQKVCTGRWLKERVQYIAKALPEHQALFVQRGPSEEVEVSDEVTLEVQGVQDGDLILVRRERAAPESASGHSIARHGRLSYYHTHRADPRFASEHSVQAGGEPLRLEVCGGIANVIRIDKFTWADDGKAVKVFVDADTEPRAVKAAGDGSNGKVEVDFQSFSFCLTIREDTRSFVLEVPKLHREVLPRDCRYRVSEGKRITVTLRKREPEWTWYTLI